MANPLLAIFSVLPVVNAVMVAVAACVIAVCAFLSRVFGHVPDWMTIPPIMMCGYLVPESVIYSGGLTVVAVGLIFCQSLLFLLRRAMLQRDWKPDDKNLVLRAMNLFDYSFSIVACLALIVQAVVPVQENILYTFYDYVKPTDDTVTHETAASCWWLAESTHWILNLIVESRSSQLSVLRRFNSFSFKVAFIAIGIVSGISGVFIKPTLPAPKSTVSLYFHATNFCYWVSTVSFFIAYFVQSWQSAIILDHLGIRSFVFGSLPSTRQIQGEPISPIGFQRNIEEHRRD